MGTINLYNSIDNSHQIINGCGKLSELLPESYFKNCILLKEGSRIDSDYYVNSEDIIFCRRTPKATSTGIAIAVTTAVVVFAGVEIGRALTSYVDNKTKAEQEKAQKDAKNLAEQIQQLPFIKGANNKSALGQSVPYVMGDVYHTPYKLTDGCYSIENGDLDKNEYGKYIYYWIPLILGFGKQLVTKVLLGDETILTRNEGTENGNYNFDSGSVYYDGSNSIQIRKAGENFDQPAFKYKTICTQDGSELKYDATNGAEPLYRTLPDNAKDVEICVQLNGLRCYDSANSRWKEETIILKAEWTNVDNPSEDDWNNIEFNGNYGSIITLNSNSTMRFKAKKEFSASECYGKKIKIRIRKGMPSVNDNSTNSAYLLYYQSTCYDANKSTSSTLVPCETVESELKGSTVRLGIKLLANDNTKDLLDEIHVLCCGMARTWNGTSWSTDKTTTRNPAAWILEILTSDAHYHSKYNDSELDLESFGRLYNYCVTNGFYTDGILTSGIKKRDLISQILSTVNADIIMNADGLLEVVIDEKEETPVALLNAENITSITYAKDFSRKADGLKVTFTNRNSWLVDTFYSYIEDNHTKSQNDIITELNLSYATTYEHCYKIAQRKMRQQKLQPKEVKVNVGCEGDYYPLYSTVLLQYTTFRIGLNSSVVTKIIKNNENKIVKVQLSDMVEMETGNSYGLIVQAVSDAGKKSFYKKIKFSRGKTNELEFIEPIDSSEMIPPDIDSVCSFGVLDANGEFTKITDTMKICAIEPNGDNGYSLTLKNYNESMYEFGTIPEFKSNLTTPPRPHSEIPQFEKLEGEKGANGLSSYTLQLFKRYADIPALPSGTLTYTFSSAALEGDLEGWTQSIPQIDEDNNPLYETHVTLTDENDIVDITTSDFSEPVIVLKDSNLTLADVQELINKVTPPPTVESDITFFGIAVDEQGICKKSQSVTMEVHVRQTEEELAFEFEEVNLPDGFEYTIDENKITITCKKDTFVKSGSIIVPVKYRAYKSNVAYVSNEDANSFYISSGNILGNFDSIEDLPSSPADNSIINWIGETTPMSRSDNDFEKDTAYQYVAGIWKKFNFTPYGYFVYEQDYTISNIGIGYTQVKGFRYLNAITSVENIPASSEVVIGDWFTWNGEDTESTLVEGGEFKQCCLYAWNGDKWEIDESTDHNTRAIFDILALADSKLKDNNAKAELFLDRLCTNQAFIKTLVVSGSAFINELKSLNIYAEQIEVARKNAIDDSLKELVGEDNVQDQTIIEGGRIKTDLIETESLKVGDKLLVSADTNFLNTDLIDADTITAGLVKTNEITSGSGTFNGLKAENIDVSGTINATSGRFSSMVGRIMNRQESPRFKVEGSSGIFVIQKMEYESIYKTWAKKESMICHYNIVYHTISYRPQGATFDVVITVPQEVEIDNQRMRAIIDEDYNVYIESNQGTGTFINYQATELILR